MHIVGRVLTTLKEKSNFSGKLDLNKESTQYYTKTVTGAGNLEGPLKP